MTLTDFVENLHLSLKDLDFTNAQGYVEGISKIFIRNLNNMDVTERPIHCSDQKRLQFYVKKENKWEKDEEHEEIDKSIAKVSKKQIENLEKSRSEDFATAAGNFTPMVGEFLVVGGYN